jgi:hypothetical protein
MQPSDKDISDYEEISLPNRSRRSSLQEPLPHVGVTDNRVGHKNTVPDIFLARMADSFADRSNTDKYKRW